MEYRKEIQTKGFSIPDLSLLKDEVCAFFHSNDPKRKSILAFGCSDELSLHNPVQIEMLDEFIDDRSAWFFGLMAYELGEVFEPSIFNPNLQRNIIPQLYFFRPNCVVEMLGDKAIIHASNEELIGKAEHIIQSEAERKPMISSDLKFNISKSEYLNKVAIIQNNIQYGNIYELNYCLNLEAEFKDDPFQLWQRLNSRTKAPFSAYFNSPKHTLICGSPERFLSRNGNRIMSQPIKGTRRRGLNPMEDQELLQDLLNDPKELAENIMITDLVRNDFSKSALPGSVMVDELCKCYSFKTVHQMISTISAEVPDGISFGRLIRDTFPMGSMTGAPKVRAMQIISEIESVARGWYSGSCGYIRPGGDFDFNVIIRSLIFHKNEYKLSAGVGGAITALSNPEAEWEECNVKVQALIESLRDGIAV